MTINGLHSNVVIPLYRTNGVSKDIAAAELNRQQQAEIKKAASEERMSKAVSDSSVYTDSEAAYVRPQYQRNAPVAPAETANKDYLNTIKFGDDKLTIEDADYYVEGEEGFPEGYEFPKNTYEPKGFYITMSPEYLASTPNRKQMSAADALKQKFYADEVRTGSLINMVM